MSRRPFIPCTCMQPVPSFCSSICCGFRPSVLSRPDTAGCHTTPCVCQDSWCLTNRAVTALYLEPCIIHNPRLQYHILHDGWWRHLFRLRLQVHEQCSAVTAISSVVQDTACARRSSQRAAGQCCTAVAAAPACRTILGSCGSKVACTCAGTPGSPTATPRGASSPTRRILCEGP